MLATTLFHLVRVQLWLAVLSASALCLFVFASAITRYLLEAPWSATEEVVGFLFYACCFLSLPATTWMARHIRLSLLDRFLPARLLRVLNIFTTAALVLMLAVLVNYCIENANFARSIGARSEISKIDLYHWILVAPFTLTSVALVAIYTLFVDARRLRPLFSVEER